jgi:hypothetical protein
VKLLAGILLFLGFSTSGSSEGLCLRFYSLMVTSVLLPPSPVARIELSLSFLPFVQGHSN